jgi:hypothetical protein
MGTNNKRKQSARPDARRTKAAWTVEQKDEAKRVMGKAQYPSFAAKELARTLGLSREHAYDLLKVARGEVYAEIIAGGNASDPLTAQYAFLVGVIAAPEVEVRDKLNAAKLVQSLLGLEKLVATQKDISVEGYLADLVAKREAARLSEPRPSETSTGG